MGHPAIYQQESLRFLVSCQPIFCCSAAFVLSFFIKRGQTYDRPYISAAASISIKRYRKFDHCALCCKKQTAMRLSVYSLQISIDLFGTFQAFADGPDDQGRSSFGISCRKQAFFRIDQVRA